MDITRLMGVSRTEDIQQKDFQSVIDFLDQQVRALTRSSAAYAADKQDKTGFTTLFRR